jgi:hypothetical protein
MSPQDEVQVQVQELPEETLHHLLGEDAMA